MQVTVPFFLAIRRRDGHNTGAIPIPEVVMPRFVVVAIVLAMAFTAPMKSEPPPSDRVNTFSICAYDPDKQEWGVAVASKYLAVGAVVPWAKAGVGAVATQSYVNVSLGPKGLDLMAAGKSAEDALKTLVEADNGRALRQLGLVDAKGEVATFTGEKCNAWAGGKTGKYYACQGNILAGEKVIEAMAKAFEESKGALAWKLMNALDAGDQAGGDKRGKQSAALLVVRDKGGPLGLNDRYLDFRVDDHKDPVPELARILALRVKKAAQ
jgi:uncharacterized Ntn-hydrolase superfamily protein